MHPLKLHPFHPREIERARARTPRDWFDLFRSETPKRIGDLYDAIEESLGDVAEAHSPDEALRAAGGLFRLAWHLRLAEHTAHRDAVLCAQVTGDESWLEEFEPDPDPELGDWPGGWPGWSVEVHAWAKRFVLLALTDEPALSGEVERIRVLVYREHEHRCSGQAVVLQHLLP